MKYNIKVNPVAVCMWIAAGALGWVFYGTLKSFVVGALIMFFIGLVCSFIDIYQTTKYRRF